MTTTVLVTCLGGTLSGALVRALTEQEQLPLRVLGADCSAHPAAASEVESCHQVPSGSSADYVPRLLELCRREGVQVILPGADEEVEAIAAQRGLFTQAGVACAVPPVETVRLLRHKGRVMQRLQDAGVPVAPWGLVRTAAELREAAGRLGYPERLVVVKPCTGRGGRGAIVLDARCQALPSLLAERGSVRLRLEDIVRFMPGAPLELLVMAYLPGDAYDADVLAHGGAVRCLALRRRYNSKGIPFTGCITVDDPALARKVRATAAALALDGCADVDLACDADGRPQVLEVNPRLSGSVVGAIAAGVHVPLEAVRWALGLPVAEHAARPGVETLPDVRLRSREACAAI